VGFASQNEERGLKGIFSIVVVAQNATADLQYQRSVTAYQVRKSAVFSICDEAIYKDGVAGLNPGLRHRLPADKSQ
jgi:hypothetical protein